MSPPEGEGVEFPSRGSDLSRIYQAARDQYIAGRDLHMHYEDGLRRARRAVRDQREPGECPYPGLAAFSAEQASWFFGRDGLTADLLVRIDEQLISGGPLVVIAPSGAGKSSLLCAGLLPAIRQGQLPAAGSEQWPHVLMTPTATPMAVLAAYLAEGTGVPLQDVAEKLAAGPELCAALMRSALGETDDGRANRRLVVVIDQMEELFTLGAGEQERHDFLNLLAELAHAGPGGEGPLALVVYGLRSDFYTSCASYPQLREVLQNGQVLVGPMTQDELREAILFPAEDVGLAVEPGLVELLLRDLGTHSSTDMATGLPGGYEAGRLPYLAHALRVTWQQRHGHMLTVDGYRTSGGIHQAIANTAERLFSDLEPLGQQAARTLFLRLVKIGDVGGEDTRRRLPHAVLRGIGGAPEAIATIIDVYTRGRLLTQSQDAFEIAHEALLHAWPRLRSWIDTDRAGHLVHQELDQAAQDWDRSRRDASMLYRGPRLEAARDWASRSHDDQASPTASAFLAASARHERRTLRIRRSAIAILSALTLIASAAAAVAFQQRSTAQFERDNAVFSQVTAEAALVRGAQPSLAAQLDLVAHRLKPGDPAVYGRLIADAGSPLSAPLVGIPGDIALAEFSRDWRMLATVGDDGAVRLWDLADRAHPKLLGRPLTGTGGSVVTVAFSPDGKTLASGGDDGVQLWDLTDRARPAAIGQPIAGKGTLNAVAFSPDGRTLVITRNQSEGISTDPDDGDVRLWDIIDRARPLQMGRPLTGTGVVGVVAFSRDGHTLATAGIIGLKLWDVTNPTRPILLAEPDTGGQSHFVDAVAFSPNGRVLAAGNADNTELWDVSDPTRPAPLGGPFGTAVQSLAFNPDGDTLASVADDGIRIWNLTARTTPTPLGPVLAGRGLVTVAFSPDGRTLASAGADGVSMWTDPPVLLLGLDPAAGMTPTFTPNGRILATTGLSGTRLWNLADPGRPAPLGNPISRLVYHEDPVAFSPDGRTLVMGDINGTRLWDTTDPSRPTALGQSIPGTSLGVESVAFSPDRHFLAIALRPDHAAAVGGGVQLWELADRAHPVRMGSPMSPTTTVTSVAFSPNGRVLAVGSTDSTQLWDVSDPTRPAPLDGPFGTAVQSLAFSTDGRTLATGGGNRARLWDLTGPTPTPVDVPLSYSGTFVTSVAFSPDRRTMAVSGNGGTQLWNLTDPSHPTALGDPVAGSAAAFSPDRHTLAIAQDSGTVQLWETDVSRAVDRICEATRNTLTRQQWQRHVSELPYDPPCP